MSRGSVWRMPVLVGVASVIGLVAALLANGWPDFVSVVLLAWPVWLSFRFGFPRRGRPFGSWQTKRKNLLHRAPGNQ